MPTIRPFFPFLQRSASAETAMPHGDPSKGMNQDGEITVNYAPPPSFLKPGQSFELKLTVTAVVRKTYTNAIFLAGWYEAQVLKVELIQKTGTAPDDLTKGPTAGGAEGNYVGSASGTYRFTFPADAKPTKLSIYGRAQWNNERVTSAAKSGSPSWKIAVSIG